MSIGFIVVLAVVAGFPLLAVSIALKQLWDDLVQEDLGCISDIINKEEK